MQAKLAFSLTLLVLGTACATNRPPRNLLSASYNFVSAGTEADVDGGGTIDMDVTGATVDYEFLEFLDNANLALSYHYRDHELDVPGEPSVETHTVRVGPRWHFELFENITWYIGPHVGVMVSADGDDAGLEFDPSFYADAEWGIRWAADDHFGVQGTVNYSYLPLAGDGLTPDVDVTGVTFGAGLYIDF